jgi:transposase
VRRLSQALGYTWKKAKKLLGKACPLRRAHFVEQLGERLKQAQEPDGPLLLFGDEAHLHLDTDLGWGWAPRGQRLYVNSTSPPLARKLTCFGFYALGETEPVRIGTVSWANADSTCQRLRALKASYPHRRLVLIWDNVRYHHAVAVRRCAEELGIELVYLPPYSPDLMPVERLWQWLRQELTALHCHRDEEELRERIQAFEAQLNDEPGAVHHRLRPKTHLDLQEEKLRV